MLQDYERKKFDPLQVEATFDTKKLDHEALIGELARRLQALSAEGCLEVLVGKKTLAAIVRFWRELSPDGDLDIAEPDVVRQSLENIARQVGCWVVRGEHPKYWIRRMPENQDALDQ